MSATTTMNSACDIDEILRVLRPVGKYQIVHTAYILLGAVQASFTVLNIIYIGYVPEHQCRELTKPLDNYGLETVGNISNYYVEYRECEIYLKPNTSLIGPGKDIVTSCLEGHDYVLDKAETITTEWDLVCDREGLSELGQTMMVIGQGLGAFFLTHISDRFGRKPLFVCSHLAAITFNFAIAFLPNITSFLAMRLILGIVQQGVLTSMAVLCSEWFPTIYRGRVRGIGAMFWTICLIILTGFGYFLRFRSWRFFMIVTSLISLYAVFGFWVVDESLRWLVANKKEKESVRIIKKIAKWNKSDGEKALSLLFSSDTTNHTTNNGENSEITNTKPDTSIDKKYTTDSSVVRKELVKKDGFLDIFKNRRSLIMTLLLWYIWTVNSMTYFGLFLTTSSLVGNRFLNTFFSAVAEVPGIIAFYLLIDRLGRKKSAIIFHAIVGISMIGTAILLAVEESNSTANTFITILTMIGKCCITATWAMLLMYTPELYPTNLRNVGLGSCSTAARIGAGVAPYSRLLMKKVVWGPSVIFGSACLLVTYIITRLPETRDRVLPQTLEEFNSWFVDKKENSDEHKQGVENISYIT